MMVLIWAHNRRMIEKNDIPNIISLVKEYISCVETESVDTFSDKYGLSVLASKEEIAENAHDPGQSTHGGAHFGVAGLVGVFNKETQQKMCHNPASYRKSVYFTIDFRKKKGHFFFDTIS